MSTELSIEADLALVQETSYQARHPRREETEAELAARGCMYHYRMHAGSLIYEWGATIGQAEGGMIIELRPVLILTDGYEDTTSDVFGRTLTAYRARDLISGREGTLTYGARGVVRTEPQLPWFPLAAEAGELAGQLAAWGTDGGA